MCLSEPTPQCNQLLCADDFPFPCLQKATWRELYVSHVLFGYVWIGTYYKMRRNYTSPNLKQKQKPMHKKPTLTWLHLGAPCENCDQMTHLSADYNDINQTLRAQATSQTVTKTEQCQQTRVQQEADEVDALKRLTSIHLRASRMALSAAESRWCWWDCPKSATGLAIDAKSVLFKQGSLCVKGALYPTHTCAKSAPV